MKTDLQGMIKGNAAGLLGAPLLLGMLATACNRGPSEAELARDQALAENKELHAQLNDRDSLISGMTLSLNDIEKNIDLLDDREKLITAQTNPKELDMDQRQRIVHNLQLMNGLMKESRERVADLTKRLDRSKIESSSLRKKLKDLDTQLASRDSSLAAMKNDLVARDFKMGQINDQLNAIELEIAKREATIHEQETQLNKAYYAMGTYKELEDRGVLTKEGGVAGIGSRDALRNDVSASAFKQVDLRDVKQIPLNHARKAVLVTEHPSDSYTFVKEDDDKLAYLEIKDPEEFWKLSKYMVVEVK